MTFALDCPRGGHFVPRLFAVTRSLQLVSFFVSCALLPSAAAQSCGSQGVAVQVLGSGGPELQDKRASSSYLVWEDGRARALVDAGGGSAVRFGESGAQTSQLDVILFTHFHVDHSADFPALIKSSWFEDRTCLAEIRTVREVLRNWQRTQICSLLTTLSRKVLSELRGGCTCLRR
jgi:Metallo-beta-lactamase superfamily